MEHPALSMGSLVQVGRFGSPLVAHQWPDLHHVDVEGCSGDLGDAEVLLYGRHSVGKELPWLDLQ